MLQLLVGRSGSGKTTAVYEQLKARTAEQCAPVLLVPEQASFESERRLLEELGPVLSQQVRVLSFTRLATAVFREIGGIAGKRMDTTVSLLLMSQAVHGVADGLSLYRRHIDDAEYLEALSGMLTECRQCAVSPRQLADAADTMEHGTLRRKLTELAQIFEAYDALTEQAALIDPQNDLTVLAKRLPECHQFDGVHVYVDGFKGFTRQEMLVLERLLPRVASLTVTICADDITPRPNQVYSRFATAISTATQLRDAAQRARVTVSPTQYLTNNHRTTDPALLALEAGCYASDGVPYEEDTDRVRVIPCDDRAEECRTVARLIRRYLREEGGHCRDFTVVARDLDGYADRLDSALRREGLPVCRDYREPILTQPLITLVESALAAVTGGWNSDDVLRIVKSGLAGFSTTSASLLENYVFLWNIRGRQWLLPFTAHPDGLTAAEDERSAKRLAYLDLLRRRLIGPLERFSKRLSGNCTGREFADAIHRLLTELRVSRMVRLQVARLDADGEHALADYQSRVWDYLIALLDKFALALADTHLPAARLAELFRLAVSTDDLGSIPQGLDGVVIGAADRIRYTAPRTVIVVGANEGIFPAYPSGGGILTDIERRQLIAAGVPMTDTVDRQTTEERFYAYMAVAAPSERLVITYAKRDGNEALLPSSLVDTVDRLLPHHVTDIPAPHDTVTSESEADAFATLSRLYRDNTATAAAYREVFGTIPAYTNRLDAMARLEHGFAFDDTDAARRLFGDHLRLSPSQVETFHQCRFAYFCKYALYAKPRKTAEINPAEAGTLAHYIMQTILPTYCKGDLSAISRRTITHDVTEAVQTYVNDCMGGADNKEPRFLALVARITRLCDFLLWRVVRELQDSGFRPVDYELPIGTRDGEDGIPPWVLTLPSGATVQVGGVVDRVDTYTENGKTYLRILDYKTGTKVFDLGEVLEGINLQMLIYLFSICENGGKRYGDITPAGVLYLPAKIPQLQTNRDLTPEELETAQLSTMKMNGLLLDDIDVLRAMEPELGGVFLPTYLTKKGTLSAGSLATLQQFGKIQKRIQDLLTTMVEQLHHGDIAAMPKMTADGSALCRYCDYRDVCGREDDDPAETMAALSHAEALASLEHDGDEEVTDDE